MAAISRLCVKGLPKHLTDQRLREHFEQTGGEVTDVRICKTSSDKDAVRAKKHFHNTFVDTSKITVEFAKPVGDESITRPWSKYSEGSSAHERVSKKNTQQLQPADQKGIKFGTKPVPALSAEQALLQKVKTDPELKAFVDAMKPRSKGRVWENEGDGLALAACVKQEAVKSKKAGGEDVLLTRTHMKFDSDTSSDEEYDEAPEIKEATNGHKQNASLDPSAIAFDANADDMQYMKAKMTSKWEDSSDDDEEDQDKNMDTDESDDHQGVAQQKRSKKQSAREHTSAKRKASEDDDGDESDSEQVVGSDKAEGDQGTADAAAHRAVDAVVDAGEEQVDEGDTGRLFVRNLAFGVTEDDLRRTFGKFGELSEVHLCVNKETKKPNGLAFVLYLMPQHAVEARAKLDGKFLQGRLLHIIPAKLPKKGDEDEDGADAAKGGYKRERDKKLKDKAGSSHNWNMLFMRADTVAEAGAAAHDMTKGDLLDANAESMAVRLALAETHVIEHTKQQLLDQGVNVAAFTVETKPKERSRTTMLVKNLPYSSEAVELQDLFARFGEVGRVVLPETKTMAIVEMVHERDAKKAFRQLAYSKFKQQPLYLEWGPVDTFLEDVPAAHASDTADDKDRSSGKKRGVSEDDDEASQLASTTLYVKNLSFETSEQALRKAVVKACGADAVRAVRIVTKPAPKGKDNQGKPLSMGYAFVEFGTHEAALEGVKKIKALVVDGRSLTAEVSNRAMDAKAGSAASKAKASVSTKAAAAAAEASDKKGSSKIIVRNVPFEATKKELKDLLGTFGQLSTLRLPKKFDGKHRGFAFADFLTHQEAAAAKKALEGTHLYGRHLVIEYAEEDNSLESLRLKTARYFSKLQSGSDGANKRQKLQDALDGEGDEEGDFESNFG